MVPVFKLWIALSPILFVLLLDVGISCWTCDQGRPNDTANNLCNINATESSVQCEEKDRGCLVVVKRVLGLFHKGPNIFKSCNRNSFWSVNLPDCGNITIGFEHFENCVCNHEDNCNKFGILNRGVPLGTYLEELHSEIEEGAIEDAVDNIDSVNTFEDISIEV
ncbi:unnamed protein product [Orchesella dallaii]|uniref:Protein sleepless n=1 Tax=Orchesella dallaii TaxID=48710 RepID=A0ABP1SAI1_9HEXA